MPAALPLTSAISQASQAKREYRVIKCQYGNGYSQRAGDGINNIVDTWNVSWENITSSEFNTISAAFDAAYGVDYFTWQAPGDASTKKFVVNSFSKTAISGSYFSIQAELEQVFDL